MSYHGRFGFLRFLVIAVGLAFIQTVLFLLILFFLERTDIFMITVSNYNSELIYPYETGGFFFALIFIADLITEGLRRQFKKERF